MKLPSKVYAADLFCGAGGTSRGLAIACEESGVEVDLVAVNHWETAVNTHAKNHPWARHYCVPVEAVNPREAFPGGVLHLLCASPECTHHSTARGGKPTNDQLRASAWHIMRWVNELDVRTILIENVPEFENWGPVSQKTGRPIKNQRGRYFKAFVEALSACGYAVQWRVLNSADYGAATSRRRLFLLARKGRKAPAWPKQTHSKRDKDGHPTVPGTLPWRAAREIIDWSLKGESIFNREERGLRPLAPKTIERILKGLERYGGDDLQPFLVLLRGTSSAGSTGDPLPSLTAGGTHVAMATPFLLGQQSGAAPRSVDDPAPTVATGGAISMVEPVVVDTFGSKDVWASRARSVEEPVPTVAGNGRWGVAEPFILPPDGPGGNGAHNHAKSIDDPMPTIRASRGGGHVVEPVLVPYYGNSGGASVTEPLPTQTCVDRFGLAEPFLVTTDRPETNRSLPRPVSEPVPTVVANGDRIALVQPYIIPNFGERDGQAPRVHDLQEPLPTVTSHGAGALVEPHIIQLTHGGRSHDVRKPLPTVTTANRGEFALVEPVLGGARRPCGHDWPDAGCDSCVEAINPGMLTEPGTATLRQPIINGRKLDILFRMLQPHELSAAMGFPGSYEFVGSKRDIVKQVGNAVEVYQSKALITSLLTGESDVQVRLPSVLDVVELGDVSAAEVSA